MPDETTPVTIDRVRGAILPVRDPEIGFSVLELGLVYDIVLANGGEDVTVKMTLTSPMCPVGPMILSAVHESVAEIEGVKNVKVELVWEPPWDPSVMASDEVKDRLGIW